MTCRHGRRCSAADAYLRPALGRPNLTVRVDALATGITCVGSRATGVTYLVDGQERVAHADMETLLCGGAVNSPSCCSCRAWAIPASCATREWTSAFRFPGSDGICRTI
ncbi:GMC family oxidoreductase N-terminal domain-containing protein [Streptomyces kaempferi]